LLTLLNDILDLSKIEAGKLALESQPFDPTRVFTDIQDLFMELADQKALSLTAIWSGPSQSYLGDPQRLRQMISNLATNAIKFTEHGGIRIEGREISRDGERAIIEFSVADTGIGIARDKQALLFQPFSQLDASATRAIGGSGLGLSIVRHLADLMGGEIGVDSHPGLGSRFWFRVPAPLAPASAAGTNQPSPRGEEAPRRLSGSVLAIEDNATNQEVIKVLVESLGLTCAIAGDGQQGLEYVFGSHPADLILMDIQMPVMDGYEAAQNIRQWESSNRRPRHPIIALTAGAYEEDRQRCLAAGMDDFLAKPIDAGKLAAVLARWLPACVAPPPGGAHPAVESPGDAVLPVFDETTLLRQLGGNRTLARKVVESARSGMLTYFARLDEALASADWAQAQRATHTMKSLAAQVGGADLTSRLRLVDTALKHGGTTDVATLGTLRAEFQRLDERLQEWLATATSG
jgi:CheY-like chemotaxis protein/HPt (histidine-containing phosphotransfer) domain-containing protein